MPLTLVPGYVLPPDGRVAEQSTVAPPSAAELSEEPVEPELAAEPESLEEPVELGLPDEPEEAEDDPDPLPELAVCDAEPKVAPELEPDP